MYTTLPHRLLRCQHEIHGTRETSMRRSLLVYRSDSSSPPGPAQRADTDAVADAGEIFESQTMQQGGTSAPDAVIRCGPGKGVGSQPAKCLVFTFFLSTLDSSAAFSSGQPLCQPRPPSSSPATTIRTTLSPRTRTSDFTPPCPCPCGPIRAWR